MQDESLAPIQIRTGLYLINKHRTKILTVFLSTVVLVVVACFMFTPIYQASSKLLVKPGREDVYVAPAGGSPAVIDASREGEKVNAEIAILNSLTLVHKLVDRFGVNHLFEFSDRTLQGRLFGTNKPHIPQIEKVNKIVLDSFEVSRVPKSNVIKVTFDWPDPVIAADAVNMLVDLYLIRHLKVHTNPETYNLLEEQVDKWERKLRESENELEDFKRLHAITSLPQQRTILLGRLSEAEAQRRRTAINIQETLGLTASLEAQLSNLHQNVRLQETVNRDTETLAILKAKLVDLEFQGLKEEISRLKEMIAKEEKEDQKVTVSGENPIHQGLETDLLKGRARLKALKAKLRNQQAQTVNYQEELKTLDGFEKKMNELERQVAIDEANYKLYLTKFEEAKISERMDRQKIANVSVIEPAVPIFKPVKPRKALNIFLGAFLGLLAGIGTAFSIEFFHPVFRTPEDVDQFLSLPVLATLPKEQQICHPRCS
jgi:uncharacterized protein involved in exopolysaccharide biosynthesis